MLIQNIVYVVNGRFLIHTCWLMKQGFSESLENPWIKLKQEFVMTAKDKTVQYHKKRINSIRKHGNKYWWLLSLLGRYDVMGLTSTLDIPYDEYDPETRLILDAIQKDMTQPKYKT